MKKAMKKPMKKKSAMKDVDIKNVLVALFLFFAGALAVLAVNALNDQATLDPRSEAAAPDKTTRGNGAPSGPHYNLNIIGKDGRDCTDAGTNDGRRIFVPLTGRTSITLTAAPEFAVLDYCGNDGKAQFALPNPDPDNTGTTTYSVWAAPKGKPGGGATMTTCATDPLTLDTVCSTNNTVQVRSTGKSKFTDVTKALLYVYADVDGDGVEERYPIFDPALEGYFWDYDNRGLKLLQLRFYPVASTVTTN